MYTKFKTNSIKEVYFIVNTGIQIHRNHRSVEPEVILELNWSNLFSL